MNEVANLPRPRNVRELRSVLSAINYPRSHIMNCSEISCVLVRMMNAKKLRRGGQQEMACNALKATVSKSAILHAFDPSLRLVLETDTSQVCTGAALYNVT